MFRIQHRTNWNYFTALEEFLRNHSKRSHIGEFQEESLHVYEEVPTITPPPPPPPPPKKNVETKVEQRVSRPESTLPHPQPPTVPQSRTFHSVIDHKPLIPVDTLQKRYLDKTMLFPDGKACLLCEMVLEPPRSWGHHQNMRHHRMSALTLTTIVQKYRNRSAGWIMEDFTKAVLIHPSSYYICQDLVSTNFEWTAKKMRETILYLRSLGVIQHSTNLSRGRSFLFDQNEWVGDLVLAPSVHAVLASIFDMETKYDSNVMAELCPIIGTGGGDGFFTGNIHLERAFDRLKIIEIVDGAVDVIGKTKSDVLEAILGELELFLNANQGESALGLTSGYLYQPTKNIVMLALHLKNVLVAMIVLSFFVPCVRRCVALVHKINTTLEMATYVPLPPIAKALESLKVQPLQRPMPLLTPSPRLPPSTDGGLTVSEWSGVETVTCRADAPCTISHQHVTGHV
eukprot:PhF_6_TR3314/c0_g1_i1/m.4677